MLRPGDAIGPFRYSPHPMKPLRIGACASALVLAGLLVWIFTRYELIPKRLVEVEPG